MDTPISRDNLNIISTIRYDNILLSSEENTRINLHVQSDLARYPVRFYMLSYHQERMVASARALGWDTTPIEGPEAYDRLLSLLSSHLDAKFPGQAYNGPLMLRIALSPYGHLNITSNGPHPLYATLDQIPYPPRNDIASQLYPSSLFAIADPLLNACSFLKWRVYVAFDKVTPSVFTQCKTTDRRVYDEALALLPSVPADTTLNGVQLQTEVLIVNERYEIMEGCRFTPYFRRGGKWITPAPISGGNLGTTRRWAIEKGLCEEGVVEGGSVKYHDIIVLSNGAKGFQAGIVLPWWTLAMNKELLIGYMHTESSK